MQRGNLAALQTYETISLKEIREKIPSQASLKISGFLRKWEKDFAKSTAVQLSTDKAPCTGLQVNKHDTAIHVS